MDDVPVVTVFLRNRGEVLLLRRSEAVGSYPGRWGAVAGHAEREGRSASGRSSDERGELRDSAPDAAAREEIREETGLHEHVELVRRGEPFPVVDREVGSTSDGASGERERDATDGRVSDGRAGSETTHEPSDPRDEDRGTRWLVHPYLFDCDARDVTPNYETTEWEWVSPTEILRRETVPELWTSYDRVRPRVETVAEDETHGSAYVSARALEVLRDEAALAVERGGSYGDLATLARDQRDARPNMQAVANRVNRAMATADGTPAGVERAARETLERALAADEAAAATAAILADGVVLTLSRSGTVAAALERASPRELLVAESRPGGEGVGVAEAFADATDVTLFPDAAVAHVLATREVDAVLVGADTVLPDGRVVNKVGTRTAAVAAAREGVPVYAVCARDKVAPDGEQDLEHGDPAAVYDGDAAVDVANPTFDVTPAALLAGVATEDGVLDADEVGEVAEELAALAEWAGR